MEVLILGHRGMLGSMVHKYYEHENIECITTEHKWPSDNFKNAVKTHKLMLSSFESNDTGKVVYF